MGYATYKTEQWISYAKSKFQEEPSKSGNIQVKLNINILAIIKVFSGAYFTRRRSTSNCKAPKSPQTSHTADWTSVSDSCLSPPDPRSFRKRTKLKMFIFRYKQKWMNKMLINSLLRDAIWCFYFITASHQTETKGKYRKDVFDQKCGKYSFDSEAQILVPGMNAVS